MEFRGTPFVGCHNTQPGGVSVPSHLLDHVVGVGSGAARAVAAQRAVDVGGEVVREVGDLKATLQAGLPAQDAPEKRGMWPSVEKGICSYNHHQDTHLRTHISFLKLNWSHPAPKLLRVLQCQVQCLPHHNGVVNK